MSGCIPFEDTPELLACALALGNSHDPGYGIFSLLGNHALRVQVGHPAFRLMLFTAACAATSAILLGGLVEQYLRSTNLEEKKSSAIGIFAALGWGWSDTFWWQGVLGEKYALLWLFQATVFLLVFRIIVNGQGDPGSGSRRFYVLACVWALAAAHHHFAVFFLPAVIILVPALCERRPFRGRRVVLAFLLLVTGATLKVIYPAVRSNAGPLLNWGNPNTLNRLVHYVSARRYRGNWGEASAEHLTPSMGMNLGRLLRRIPREVPWHYLLLVPLGIHHVVKTQAVFGGVVLASAVFSVFFNLRIEQAQRVDRWHQPLYFSLYFYSAIGLSAGLGYLFRRAGEKALRLWMLSAILFSIPAWYRGGERNDNSQTYLASDFAKNILNSLPGNSTYLGRGDEDLFPIWAAQIVDGRRPDVLAAGMGGFVDASPSDVGFNALVKSRLRIGLGWDALRSAVWNGPSTNTWYAKVGYPPRLASTLQLELQRAHGFVATFRNRLNPAESIQMTEKVMRGYTFRGIMYGPNTRRWRVGVPRDDIEHDAIWHHVAVFTSLAESIWVRGDQVHDASAAKYYRLARMCSDSLVGGEASSGGSEHQRVRDAQWERRALGLSLIRLASTMDGVRSAASLKTYSEYAVALLQ